jgi:hypothetical protein
LRRLSTAGNDLLGLAAIDCDTALFHFRKHIPEVDWRSRREVSAACPDYKFIADITNAVKHGSFRILPDYSHEILPRLAPPRLSKSSFNTFTSQALRSMDLAWLRGIEFRFVGRSAP